MKLIFFLLLTKLIFCLKLRVKRWADKEDNPDDEELGKTTKGDSIGTNLYNSQVVTKAFIRPQTWFFNVDLTRPSKRIFEEAESNGLHYQIDRIRNELEKDYRRNMEELYDQRLEGLENKMRNAAKIKKFKMKSNIMITKPIQLKVENIQST